MNVEAMARVGPQRHRGKTIKSIKQSCSVGFRENKNIYYGKILGVFFNGLLGRRLKAKDLTFSPETRLFFLSLSLYRPFHPKMEIKSFITIIIRFVIPVVFYEITKVQCVYWSDTAVFIGRIYSIFYIRYNYMFRRLIMAIFRLYMKYLLTL